MSTSTRPVAVLFDWDNTLVDTWGVIHDALNKTFVEFGLEPWTMDQVRGRVRRSMRESFPPLFGDRWEEAGSYFMDAFAAVHLERIAPINGAEDMLRTFQSLGLFLGVVSNKTGEFLREEAEHLAWDGFFGRIIGATDAPQDKPARDPVDLALTSSGFETGPNVWFVGDTDVDLECAVNAGCTPVLIRETAPRTGEFADYPPVYHFESCLALSNFVQNM